ncbi:MAG: hypothetical protein ABJF10_27210 [Chthoniobacter sp.]
MTLFSLRSPLADIVIQPPPPPPSPHHAPPVSPLPYLVLALVAVGVLLLLRKRRPSGSVAPHS